MLDFCSDTVSYCFNTGLPSANTRPNPGGRPVHEAHCHHFCDGICRNSRLLFCCSGRLASKLLSWLRIAIYPHAREARHRFADARGYSPGRRLVERQINRTNLSAGNSARLASWRVALFCAAEFNSAIRCRQREKEGTEYASLSPPRQFVENQKQAANAWRSAMELVVGLGFMLGLWILVIWGSNYFNKNVQ
jgi:hypothetical protein